MGSSANTNTSKYLSEFNDEYDVAQSLFYMMIARKIQKIGKGKPASWEDVIL